MMFHRIPTRNTDRMKTWLIALNIDPNTPKESIKGHYVCSVHFTDDDYIEKMQFATRTTKRVLKDTAIPSKSLGGQSAAAAVSSRSIIL